ncbi:hypothetical protein ISCGN_003747 [Ixodes scapularis]
MACLAGQQPEILVIRPDITCLPLSDEDDEEEGLICADQPPPPPICVIRTWSAASGPYPVQLSVAEDRTDNSSDTGVSSMGSERVPSISEDHEWLDSCSESSSHADGEGGDLPRFLGSAQKKYKLFGRKPPGPGENDTVVLGVGGGYPCPAPPHHYPVPVHRLPGGATVALVPKPASAPNFPSPHIPRLAPPVGALVQHNHSYSAAEAASSTAEEGNTSDEDEVSGVSRRRLG